jgi:hypothetical protein
MEDIAHDASGPASPKRGAYLAGANLAGANLAAKFMSTPMRVRSGCCARRERPFGRGAAECGHQFPPSNGDGMLNAGAFRAREQSRDAGDECLRGGSRDPLEHSEDTLGVT